MRLYLICLILAWPIKLVASSELSLRLAVAQYRIDGSLENQQFLSKITAIIKDAAKQKAEMLVLPEWVVLDRWPESTKLQDREVIELIEKETTARYIKHLKSAASKHQLIVVGGSVPFVENKKIYNMVPIVFPDGRLKKHKKVRLTKWERRVGFAAGLKPTVIETRFGKVAILTCYDVEFPDLSVDLVRHHPEVLLVPSMTESQAGAMRVRWSAQARAVEHTAYVAVSVTAGKPQKDWPHFGKARIITPQLPGFAGQLKVGKPNAHGVIIADLDLTKLRKMRAKSPWQPAKDLRQLQNSTSDL